MKTDHASLLIAVMVSLLAIGGMVLQGRTTGLAPYTPGESGLCACPEGFEATFTGRSGGLASCVCHKVEGQYIGYGGFPDDYPK